jgi:hypothetical protein
MDAERLLQVEVCIGRLRQTQAGRDAQESPPTRPATARTPGQGQPS